MAFEDAEMMAGEATCFRALWGYAAHRPALVTSED